MAFSAFAYIALTLGLATGQVAVVVVLSTVASAVTVLLARALNAAPVPRPGFCPLYRRSRVPDTPYQIFLCDQAVLHRAIRIGFQVNAHGSECLKFFNTRAHRCNLGFVPLR